MANFPLKIGTGLGLTVGSTGLGIYGFYKYSNTTDTVENYLKKNNLSPVSESNSAFWTKVFETYKLEKTNFEIDSKGVLNADLIKTWCKTNLKNKIKSRNDSVFQKASKWCVEYKTIKETLGSEKFETLPATLQTKYSNLDSTTKSAVDAINVSEQDNQNVHKIKKWCEENSNRRLSNYNNALLENMQKVCLKAS